MNDTPAKPDRPDPESLTPEQLVNGLKKLIDVVHEPDASPDGSPDYFRGRHRADRISPNRQRVFGGQVIAQGLMAAIRTVDDGKTPHSLHAYFMRPGNDDLPIHYQVRRDFDGRSFSTRRVVAWQNDKPILNMATSFHIHEPGFSHQFDMPDVPRPEDLKPEAEHMAELSKILPEKMLKHITRPRPVEFRPVDFRPPIKPEKRPPYSQTWIRAAAEVGDDPNMQACILAFATDMALLGTCTLPHGVSWMDRNFMSASLDHAIWFHEPVKMDDWHLYATDSPWSGHARGFNRGSIYSSDGKLVASVAQEGLVRVTERD